MRLVNVQTIKDFERNGRIIKSGSELSITPELMQEYAVKGIIRMNDNGKPYLLPPDEIRKVAKQLKKNK